MKALSGESRQRRDAMPSQMPATNRPGFRMLRGSSWALIRSMIAPGRARIVPDRNLRLHRQRRPLEGPVAAARRAPARATPASTAAIADGSLGLTSARRPRRARRRRRRERPTRSRARGHGPPPAPCSIRSATWLGKHRERHHRGRGGERRARRGREAGHASSGRGRRPARRTRTARRVELGALPVDLLPEPIEAHDERGACPPRERRCAAAASQELDGVRNQVAGQQGSDGGARVLEAIERTRQELARDRAADGASRSASTMTPSVPYEPTKSFGRS